MRVNQAGGSGGADQLGMEREPVWACMCVRRRDVCHGDAVHTVEMCGENAGKCVGMHAECKLEQEHHISHALCTHVQGGRVAAPGRNHAPCGREPCPSQSCSSPCKMSEDFQWVHTAAAASPWEGTCKACPQLLPRRLHAVLHAWTAGLLHLARPQSEGGAAVLAMLRLHARLLHMLTAASPHVAQRLRWRWEQVNGRCPPALLPCPQPPPPLLVCAAAPRRCGSPSHAVGPWRHCPECCRDSH